ncbi:STAS domain-containing protein [Amycolatopsis mongoliensis]|uniref:STAS domain-containing protein n=1 Tax=Amycolatopsis mongoliensis TaxID=715475 RepID=A0A9Y2K0A7_9PSEU|nr:STAS domain-containing protein [Amycolatopsis sp. 4-36]WIY06552.1 STAS domain-containing protein [Amycolatopsis sp. 4-36]
MHDTITRPGVAFLLEAPPRIAITTTAERTVVAVSGELDLAVTGRLAARLGEEIDLAPRALVIDLTHLAFCSARGLSVVLDATAAARAAGVPVAVVADGRAVLRPVEALGLEDVLPLHRTLADAEDRLAVHTEEHHDQ